MSIKINGNFVTNCEPEIDSHYKMTPNMSQYTYKELGTKLSMFFNNIEIPDYVLEEKAYTVKDSDVNRLDNVSYKNYGTPELFWLIMLVNNIVDPFDVPTGTVLRILPKNYIMYNILKSNKDEVLF